MWQLCINGLDGKNYVVKIQSNEPEQTTVATLKKLVQEETGISPENQRLLYGAKQMEDGKRLCDYPPLGNGASIMLVLRLPGGGGFFSSNDTADTTPAQTNGGGELPNRSRDTDTFSSQTNDKSTRNIDKSIPRSSDGCMITLTSGDSLLTPCNHSISPDSLLEYCWSEISNIKHEIKCPLCETEWSLDMIKRYGGASEIEMKQLETGISRNACINNPTIQKCPFCGVFCERQNTKANSVMCILCTKNLGENKVFCWMCLKPWKSASLVAASCGNEECNVNKGKLQRLRKSPMVDIKYIQGKKIYQWRACPNCGVLIEHAGGCKQMKCTKCNTEFCFICLRKRFNGSWSCGSYYTACGLAPIQTVIPSK